MQWIGSAPTSRTSSEFREKEERIGVDASTRARALAPAKFSTFSVLKLSLGPSLDPRLPLAALILLSHPLSILFFVFRVPPQSRVGYLLSRWRGPATPPTYLPSEAVKIYMY